MKIDKPNFSLIEIYPEATNHYRDKDKMNRMKSIQDRLLEDEKRYCSRMSSQTLFLEAEGVTHNKDITIQDLVDLYKDKLVKKNYSIRTYYDQIRTSSQLCAYCGERLVSTVDHFLAKTKYPNFAITPINLIPCCSDCNKIKDNYKYDRKEHLFFHPYEEDTNSFKWLKAKLEIKNEILMFEFYVDGKKIDKVTYQRMKNQFKILDLQNYFNKTANVKFQRDKNFYRDLFYKSNNGIIELYKHFKMEQYKHSLDDNYLNAFTYVYYSTLLDNLDIVCNLL